MTHPWSTAEALRCIASALDRVDHAQRRSADHLERLALVATARRLCRRLEALSAVLVAEADAANSSVIANGTPTTTWLSLAGDTSAKEAAGLVFGARELAEHDQVLAAALSGEIGLGHARVISRVLSEQPTELGAETLAAVEHALVERAATLPADRLARVGAEVLAAVAPELVPSAEQEQERLDRRAERAQRARSLVFCAPQDGSVAFRGSLPVIDAERFSKVVDAYAESDRRRGREVRDVRLAARSPEQRRADGLLAMVDGHESGRRAPSLAGDRPRVVVTMRLDELRQGAEQAGLLSGGEPVSAGELRRLCCDADLLPAVLGASSEVLDVGRAQRLVTPAIRRALSLRDGGCVFPGCRVGDAASEAHHIRPWFNGGATALHNLVLLCGHHHQLVEPPRFFTGVPPDRWQIRLDATGTPEVIPPWRVDRDRTPMPCQQGPALRRSPASSAARAVVGGEHTGAAGVDGGGVVRARGDEVGRARGDEVGRARGDEVGRARGCEASGGAVGGDAGHLGAGDGVDDARAGPPPRAA